MKTVWYFNDDGDLTHVTLPNEEAGAEAVALGQRYMGTTPGHDIAWPAAIAFQEAMARAWREGYAARINDTHRLGVLPNWAEDADNPYKDPKGVVG